jgi:GH15 family glucan-1,4-alpha-glucosidase
MDDAHPLRVLKGLIYNPTGGIVAAPTTAGGDRRTPQLDYRFCCFATPISRSSR